MHDDEAISSHPDYAYSGRYKEPPHGLWYVIWAESAEVIGMDSEPALTGFKINAGRKGPEAA